MASFVTSSPNVSETVSHHLASLQVSITGELDKEGQITNFRGIPYATVNERWTHSTVLNSLPDSFDATDFGPRCVQKSGAVLVTGGENDPTPGDDEFNCLNLNVTVPTEFLPGRAGGKKGLLPVMVWIHGGAFNFGANSVARYRASNLSMLGLSHTTPVVIVQIQYRLGVLGFAASSDISSSSPSAILGNYGLVDQINALQWVQAHISSFGGDPTNVTAFGVSAGSASVHYHILTGNPLFDRAICMSGSAPVLGPLDFKLFEEAWTNSCVKLGIADLSPAERLQHLRAMKPLEVLEVYSGSPFGPVADGKLLPSQWTLGDVHPVTRCKQLILGDTRVEAIIMDGLIQSIAQDKWQDMVSSHFSSPTVAEGFKTAFGFPAFAVPELPYEEYRDLMRRFLSVGMFQHGALGVAETFAPAGKAYLYHFEEPSPYPGPTLGLPYHGQCALFVYQNHVPEYPTEAAATAREMGKIWTAFAHGKEPWNEYKVGGEFMRLGPEGKCEMVSMQEDNCRDYSYLPWLRENFEEVRGFVQKVTIRP